MEIRTGGFVVRLAQNESELRASQVLRYQEMILDYCQKNVNQLGYDVDQYDEYAEHLIAIEESTNKVVGSYRIIINPNRAKNQTFMTEEEFDISNILSHGENVMELSRAIIEKDYRNGVIIKLLWRFILNYAEERNIRYVIGEASYYGIDPNKYKESLSYLYHNCLLDDSFNVLANPKGCFSLNILPKAELDNQNEKRLLPPLIKGYLAFGGKVAKEGFIDYSFGSTDVFVCVDMNEVNRAYIKRLFRI